MRTTLPLLLAPLLGCNPPFLEVGPCQEQFTGPAIATCELPGWPGRDYDLVLPEGYDGSTPVPLVVAIHGGGGNKEAAERTTCSSGEPDDPSCLHKHAQDHGYAVVFPDGTSSRLIKKVRTWNAGGGEGDWRCVSGRACEDDVDDVGYIRDLVADLSQRVAVDPDRVFATGLSNGGAMSHRLACEASDLFAAVAPIGGAMQLTTSDVCEPEQPVAVLHSHGTLDPCWRYEGGEPDCPTGQKGLAHVSVERTLDEWAEILGCEGDPVEEQLPDTVQDGTTTTRLRWSGCAASLEHLRVDGGGHLWPDGFEYLGEDTIGPAWRDWGNEQLWAFFEDNGR